MYIYLYVHLLFLGTLRFVTFSEAGELLPGSAIPNDDFCSFQDPSLDCFQTGNVYIIYV